MNEELLNRNRNINRGFRKLIVWKEAIDFYTVVCQKIDTLNNISFKVNSQIDGSAFSVHSNIAEGYARRSLKDHINFNNYALGSLAENYSQIFALVKVKKIDESGLKHTTISITHWKTSL
ncbi:MAG: four helix bundle protein [Bacteroidota bacterium]|nr:four helix bundle protein [Bacteroidota bacterium]